MSVSTNQTTPQPQQSIVGGWYLVLAVGGAIGYFAACWYGIGGLDAHNAILAVTIWGIWLVDVLVKWIGNVNNETGLADFSLTSIVYICTRWFPRLLTPETGSFSGKTEVGFGNITVLLVGIVLIVLWGRTVKESLSIRNKRSWGISAIIASCTAFAAATFQLLGWI